MEECDTCGQAICDVCGGCGCTGNECSCGSDTGDDEDTLVDEEL